MDTPFNAADRLLYFELSDASRIHEAACDLVSQLLPDELAGGPIDG